MNFFDTPLIAIYNYVLKIDQIMIFNIQLIEYKKYNTVIKFHTSKTTTNAVMLCFIGIRVKFVVFMEKTGNFGKKPGILNCEDWENHKIGEKYHKYLSSEP